MRAFLRCVESHLDRLPIHLKTHHAVPSEGLLLTLGGLHMNSSGWHVPVDPGLDDESAVLREVRKPSEIALLIRRQRRSVVILVELVFLCSELLQLRSFGHGKSNRGESSDIPTFETPRHPLFCGRLGITAVKNRFQAGGLGGQKSQMHSSARRKRARGLSTVALAYRETPPGIGGVICL